MVVDKQFHHIVFFFLSPRVHCNLGWVGSGRVGSECRVGSQQAVVAHACHGHWCRPSPVPLSGTGKKKRGGEL